MSSIARSQGKNSSSKTFFLFPLHREICQLEISNIINLSTNNERTNNDGVKAKINYVFRSSFSFMALLRTLHCSLDKISFQLAMKWREFFCNSRDKLISVYVRTCVCTQLQHAVLVHFRSRKNHKSTSSNVQKALSLKCT